MSAEDRGRNSGLVREQTAQYAIGTAIGAACMLYVGFGLSLEGISTSGLYNSSVDALTWMMKIGGIAMAVTAALLWAGVGLALLIDGVLTLAVGGAMLIIGGIWITHSDMQGFLLLIFGAVYISSGWSCWRAGRGLNAWQQMASADDQVAVGASPPPVAVVDPDAQKQAMERLLASKKREMPAEPVPTMKKPMPRALRALEQTPPPVQAPPRVPDQVPPLAKHEPPPEGFLAELGRDDTKQDL